MNVPPPRSWKIHKRVFADVEDLIDALPVPSTPGVAAPLLGASLAQQKYGESVRQARLRGWRHRLPGKVYDALLTIVDATWWIANQDAQEDIGWPDYWVKNTLKSALEAKTRADAIAEAAEEFECPGCGKSRFKKTETQYCDNPACEFHKTKQEQARAKAKANAEAVCQAYAPESIDETLEFARKAAMSPELAFLTITALLYRQTKDKKVLAKFTESRVKVQGFLSAIDKIAGTNVLDT